MGRKSLLVLMVSAIFAVSCSGVTTPSTLTPSTPVSPTCTPTPTPVHTATSTATPMSIPTLVATPAPIPRPEAIVATKVLNVRSGPGTNYNRVGQVIEGDRLKVVGRTEASAWLKVVTSDGQEGWVAAEFVTVNADLGPVAVAQAPPTPTVTPTPQVRWIPVKGGENLIQDVSWECVPGVNVVNGKLVITTGSNYHTPINQYGPHLEIYDDFGVSATIEAATNDLVAISLFGALPQGEWWREIKRLDVGIRSGEVSITIWDGTKPNPATSRSFRASGLSRKVQLELRKVGGEFIVRANGIEVGRLDDPGLFVDGKVYLGVNVAPRNQLTVHSLSALTEEGQETNVQINKPWITAPIKGTAGPSLRSLAQARGIRIGAAVAPEPLLSETLYAETLGREFNILTTENAMKFEPVHPSRDHYTFCGADAIVAFAKANDMQVRGHTLVWHYQLPHWLTEGSFTRDELEMILQEHIFMVVGRFRGQVTYWDVVNEAVADDGSLRDTIWLRGIGPEYIDLAFRWAHEADPQARLFYNDYGGEGLGPKSDAIYNLVQGLLQRGVPIHGVGLQMHISLESSPEPQDIAGNMNRLGALGLEVHITELDVRIEGPLTEEKLSAQASIYRDILEACLSAQNCKAFVLWGFTDRHSWIPNFFPGSGAALIFDESYSPKPAYNALIDALGGR